MNDIELFELYDIWYQPPWFIRYFFLLIGVGIIGISGFLLYRWYKKRFSKRKNYGQIALENLAELDCKNHKSFYFSLTALLKKYLSARYGTDLNGKTDQEMVEYFDTNKFIDGHVEDLKKIFNVTTAVKFSDQDVHDSILQEHLFLSIQVVKNTMPKEG